MPHPGRGWAREHGKDRLYSVFTSMRALEQFRTFVAYPSLNVKVIAGLGGYSAGIEGVTHQAMEDLGIIRSIPNVALIVPADAPMTRLAVRASAAWDGPVYIRIGRDPTSVVFNDTQPFVIGKANLLRQYGNDVAILVTGCMVEGAIQASELLNANGIKVNLLEMHTLKPLDEGAIAHAARSCSAIVTVEEHSIIGGLASAVAEVLARTYPAPMESVAAPDNFAQSDTPQELKAAYGLTAEAIIDACRRAIDRVSDPHRG
jgi:transketolase